MLVQRFYYYFTRRLEYLFLKGCCGSLSICRKLLLIRELRRGINLPWEGGSEWRALIVDFPP